MSADNSYAMKVEVVPWTIRDFINLLSSIFLIVILCALLESFVFGSSGSFLLTEYAGSITSIILPIIWIKKRYGLTKRALGLTKEGLNNLRITLIGIITAIVFYFIGYIVFLGPYAQASGIEAGYVWLILSPISLTGISTFFLSPISEEIVFRGVIYGYVRNREGMVLGIVAQAFLFSVLHMGGDGSYPYHIYFAHLFLFGITAAVLYEKTGSLYVSMVFHGFVNYFVFIRQVYLQ